MGTKLLTVIALLTTLCALPNSSFSLSTKVVRRVSADCYERLSLSGIQLKELEINRRSCTKTLLRELRTTHGNPKPTSSLFIWIGYTKDPKKNCALVHTERSPVKENKERAHTLENRLRNGEDVQKVIEDIFLTTNEPSPYPEDAQTLPYRDQPPAIPTVYPAIAHPQTERPLPAIVVFEPLERAPTVSSNSWLLYPLIPLLIVVGYVAGVRLVRRTSSRNIKNHPAPTPGLSDDELLAKHGFSSSELEKITTNGMYERQYRERLYRAGIELFLLGNLVEAAEKRYPVLWKKIRHNFSTARSLLAKEMDLRHMDVVFNRENRSLRERIVHVCRALELTMSAYTLLFEAFRSEYEDRFRAYQLVRNLTPQLCAYEERSDSLPATEAAPLKDAVRRFKELTERIRRDSTRDWSATCLELTTLWQHIETTAKPAAPSPTTAVPTTIIAEPTTRQIVLQKKDVRSFMPDNNLVTVVPGKI